METINVADAQKDDRQPFLVRMPAELHRELKTFATARGEVLSDLIVEVVQAWWAKHPDRELFAKAAEAKTIKKTAPTEASPKKKTTRSARSKKES